MDKITKLLLIVLALLILLDLFLYFKLPTLKADAWYQNDTIIVTPTPEIEDNDCLAPGQADLDNSSDDALCVTPTPTSSPSASQNTSDIPSNPSTNTTNAPAASTCNIAFDAPILQGFHADGNGSVTFSWWGVTNIDKYSIIYGYSPESLIYGEDNIPATSTSIQINLLQPARSVYAIVSAWRNGCKQDSNILDPIVR